MNKQLNEGFKQVCVWPATVVGKEQVAEFEQFMLTELGARVQYLEEITTAPDLNKFGCPIDGSGGRNDLFFAVHTDDIAGFAVKRLMMGIRWLEDVYGNNNGNLYPQRCVDYMCWDGYVEKYSLVHE